MLRCRAGELGRLAKPAQAKTMIAKSALRHRATLTFAERAQRFGHDVRALARIFKRPSGRMAERPEYAPTDDVLDKIVSMAVETTGKPADLNSITGDKEPQRHKAGTFNAVAFQRAKLAKRLAKPPLPGDSPAWFDPQLPVS